MGKKKNDNKPSIIKQMMQSIEGMEEAALNVPLVTILGMESVNIENFLSIVEYGENCIKLKTKIGYITVEGKNLVAKSMNQEEMVINGKIASVSYTK